MKFCLIFVCIFFTADCKPSGYGFANHQRRGYYNPQQEPDQAMMFSGFYGPPANGYGHQGSMSAFLNKDMILTNSFAGEELPIYFQNRGQSTVEEQQGDSTTVQEKLEPLPVAKPQPQPPKKKSQKKNKRKPVTTTLKPIDDDSAEDEEEDDVEDDEEQDEEVPLRGVAPKPQGPKPKVGGNTYFPIVFGQGGNSHPSHPGAAVAIANAFSTGKGGVASSHATAYGDPYFSTLNRPQNNKKSNRNKNKQY